MTMLADGQAPLTRGGLVNYLESFTRPPKHGLTVPLIFEGGRTSLVRIAALRDGGIRSTLRSMVRRGSSARPPNLITGESNRRRGGLGISLPLAVTSLRPCGRLCRRPSSATGLE